MRVSTWYRWKSGARWGAIIALSLVAVALLAGCAQTQASSGPRVFFTEPKGGASVSAPVTVKMGAENFTVEPAGEVKEGRGHLHIMVDTDCVAPGEVIPKDDSHLHYGQGQMEASLDLAPGVHRLCLQAADGAHRAVQGEGLKHEISVTVK